MPRHRHLFVLLMASPAAHAGPVYEHLTPWLICALAGLVVAALGIQLHRLRTRHERIQQHQQKLVESLEQTNQLFNLMFNASPIGMLVQDEKLRPMRANEAMTRILDLPPATIEELGIPLRELIVSDSVREEFGRLYEKMLQRPMHLHGWELEIRTPAGRHRWVRVHGQTLVQNEQVRGIVWMVEDITRTHKTRLELEALSRTDPLTGLMNRRAFMEKWREEQARARRYGYPLTFLLLDLDHFKKLNDQWGHHAGDQVLKWFATLMREHLRPSDLCARFGGEEFAILMPHTDQKAGCAAAQKLQQLVSTTPCILRGGLTLQVSFSAGLAQWRENEPFETLFHRADEALYAAKQAGRDQVICWRDPAET